MANTRNDRKGFALVAVVILLTVFGLLLATFNPTKAVNSYNKYNETLRRMETVSKAMENYHESEGFFPCPASRKVAAGNVDFGKACADPTSCPGDGWACPTTSGSHVYIGTVPTHDLGLGDDYMFDGWGNRFTYAVDRSKIDGEEEPILRIKSLATPTEYMVNPPPYYLGSVGPNGIGGYNAAGTVPVGKECASSTGTDKPNCIDTGYEFINDKWVTTGGTKMGATRPFDDIMANSDKSSYYSCPAGVGGCSLWLDASDIDADGVEDNFSNGDAIDEWKDKSGNGYDAVQATLAKDPAYAESSTANNMPAVRFQQANNDWMQNDAFLGANKSTIFVVAKQGATTTGHQRIFHASSSTDQIIFLGADAGNFAVGYGNVSTWTAFPSALTPGIPMSSYAIYSATHDATSQNSFPYVNSARKTAVYGATVAYKGFMLGAQNGGGQSWDGDVAELIVYNRVLNAEERARVECYLGAKYDLPNPCECPAKVGGCHLWLSADDLDGDGEYSDEPADGTEVQHWLDRSGYGYSAEQANITFQPLLTYEAFGTVRTAKGVRTDGVDDLMVIDNINMGSPYTAIIAYKALPGNQGRIFSADAALGDNWLLGTWSDLAGTNDSAAYFNSTFIYQGNADSTDTYIAIGTNDGTASAFYLNGTATGQQTSNGTWGDKLLIGRVRSDILEEMATADVGEIVIYPYVLTAPERKQVECYLGHKYEVLISNCK